MNKNKKQGALFNVLAVLFFSDRFNRVFADMLAR